MGLKSLVENAKKISYKPVLADQKTDWDYIYESIWLSLHNDVQTKTLFILADMFLPIKFIAKYLIKSFIDSQTMKQ